MFRLWSTDNSFNNNSLHYFLPLYHQFVRGAIVKIASLPARVGSHAGTGGSGGQWEWCRCGGSRDIRGWRDIHPATTTSSLDKNHRNIWEIKLRKYSKKNKQNSEKNQKSVASQYQQTKMRSRRSSHQQSHYYGVTGLLVMLKFTHSLLYSSNNRDIYIVQFNLIID